MARSQGTGLNGRDPLGRPREGVAAALQRWLAPTAVGRFRSDDEKMRWCCALSRWMRVPKAKDHPPLLPKQSCESNKINPVLFDELVNLLTQMLVADFQTHTKSTVGSPPQTNRK